MTTAWASEAEERARLLLTSEKIASILDAVPDKWLLRDYDGIGAAEKRQVYADFFARRLKASAIFREEAERARAQLL